VNLDPDAGPYVHARLKEISDQIVDLRKYLSVAPGNAVMISVLERERKSLIKMYIKEVT
jgi:hypothetical protein